MGTFRLPSNSQRVTIVGRTGSGKTVGGAWLLAQTVKPKSKWVIVDFKRDSLLGDIPGLEEIDISGSAPSKPGLYVVRPNPADTENVESFLFRIWEKENTGLFIDEGYMLARSKALQAILTQGRSKKIPTFLLTQRPAWITRFAWSEADFVQIYRINLADDRKTVTTFVTPFDPDLSPLPPFHSYWYDSAKEKLIILTPAPDEDTILNRFEDNMGLRKSYL